MEHTAQICIQITGYVQAALALWILLRCALSMLQEKYEPEVWAYVELPGGSSRAIHHWECILGRSHASDIVLAGQAGVDRSHAALRRDDHGQWTVWDLGSREGVFVNGQKIQRQAPLNDRDELRLGQASLHFMALSDQQRNTLQRNRAEPGRRAAPGGTMFLLTLFQLLILTQHLLSAQAAYREAVGLSFGVLIALEWVCYFFMRSLSVKGFEPETVAFFLTSVGFSVAASSVPENMVKQCFLLIGALGLFLALGWWLRDMGRVRALRWPMGAAALGFLGLNLLLSEAIWGAKNWLSIAGHSLQPSEFVKIAYVYAGAAPLDRLFRKRNLLMFIVFSAVCVGALALMGDFGTALVFFCCFLVISFMRSGSFATVFLALSGAGLAGMLVLTVKPYVAQRFANWRHVWEDPTGAGFQQVRTMTATASGGLFGHGAGNGWLEDVVAADTDLVFGVVCEELGLITGMVCILAVLLLAFFAVRNAAAGRSSFHVIAACAAVSIMMAQLALNVFGSLDILPFTGVTFPFVSRGGSSLISCWALLAYIKAGDTRKNASFALSNVSRKLRGRAVRKEAGKS